MRVEFLEKFNKDLDKISSDITRQSLKPLIFRVESARSLIDIPQVKKLTGFKSAYRIRLGDYRDGIFVEGDLVQFVVVSIGITGGATSTISSVFRCPCSFKS